jgi:hypothetical protein
MGENEGPGLLQKSEEISYFVLGSPGAAASTQSWRRPEDW